MPLMPTIANDIRPGPMTNCQCLTSSLQHLCSFAFSFMGHSRSLYHVRIRARSRTGLLAGPSIFWIMEMICISSIC
ncbi:hypothetical protein DAI22_12g192825 [Oryza sativa Japonica Group]|nr:hypothetical protein DAI22_12g192825 [Oryza sativa Japonica Group]